MKATHFIARKRQHKPEGFAITLYRFKHNRPEYLGPLGWNHHTQQNEKDVLEQLKPIAELEPLTGDNLEADTFCGLNIYAG